MDNPRQCIYVQRKILEFLFIAFEAALFECLWAAVQENSLWQIIVLQTDTAETYAAQIQVIVFNNCALTGRSGNIFTQLQGQLLSMHKNS